MKEKDIYSSLPIQQVGGMNNAAERQFESELTKPKPTKTVTIKQLTKKGKWWKVF